ncbi:MAG: helix-turn-helix domain-containing protein [Clostridia bacterium]|nr:helix-turn-helix domain-containing protein [Clostridia bacterium]
MKFAEIMPVVHSMTPRKYFPGHKKTVQPHSCELLLVQEGEGEVRFGNRRAVPIAPGSIVVVPEDSAYAVHPQDGAISGIAVEYDYTQDGGERTPFEDAVCLNEPVALRDVPLAGCIISSYMLSVYLRKEPFWQVQLSAGMGAVLTRIVQHADSHMRALIDQVIDLVSERYMEPLNNGDIASELGYHPNYVNSVFVRDMGMSLHQYLMRYRVEMAMQLLLTTQLPIAEIAVRVGFRHFSHFSNCFHRLTGVAPAAYRLER